CGGSAGEGDLEPAGRGSRRATRGRRGEQRGVGRVPAGRAREPVPAERGDAAFPGSGGAVPAHRRVGGPRPGGVPGRAAAGGPGDGRGSSCSRAGVGALVRYEGGEPPVLGRVPAGLIAGGVPLLPDRVRVTTEVLGVQLLVG